MRRQVLEELLGDARGRVVATLHTDDLTEALMWLEALPAQGIEGLVIKAAADSYWPGRRRGWLKYKPRQTTEAIIGGITGSLARPRELILGRCDSAGVRLRVVGRTVPVPAAAQADLAAVLVLAGDEHPWPIELPAGWAGGLYGSRPPIRYTRVEPDTVVEISVDVAIWRHPARLHRLRPDLTLQDVPTGLTL